MSTTEQLNALTLLVGTFIGCLCCYWVGLKRGIKQGREFSEFEYKRGYRDGQFYAKLGIALGSLVAEAFKQWQKTKEK